MENPKADKVAVVDEVRSRFEESDAVIVTEYRGLKVKDLSVLRRSLAPLGAEYRIYKNTLVRIAAGGAGDEFVTLLSGPTALTFVKGDAAAVTKALRDFSRANQLLVVKGGLLGHSVLGPRDTLALADLPSREVLLARLAGGLAAPLQNFAGLLAALPRNFAYGLAALRDKKVASGEVAETPAPDDAPAADSEAGEPNDAAPAEGAEEAAPGPEPGTAVPGAGEPGSGVGEA
jgi:large subunit ribosomal protein L10